MCQRYGRGRSRLEVEDHLQATAYYFLHEQNFYRESINIFYVIVKRQLKVRMYVRSEPERVRWFGSELGGPRMILLLVAPRADNIQGCRMVSVQVVVTVSPSGLW